jgi:hypothetical protein
LELRVLLLLSQRHQLAHHVAEQLREDDGLSPVGRYLIEHVLEADQEKRCLLEGEVHHLQHDRHEVLHAALSARQSLELSLDQRQLPLEHQSADVRRRILFQWFVDGRCQPLLGIVQTDAQRLLPVDEASQCCPELTLLLVLELPQQLEFLLLSLAHAIKLLR